MKFLLHLFLSIFLVSACKKDASQAPNTDHNIPVVQSSAQYDVLMDEGVVYAEGLTHESPNSAAAESMPLKLDVYYPDNESQNRPVYLFIHGGGFIGGSRKQSQIVNRANYYTSRGWVFVSIDYRLRDDKGSVPQKWLNYASMVPTEQAAQFLAIYPAQRDAKAALRWLVAHAEDYKINTDYITVGGGSAGAITAIAAGISDAEDFTDEVDAAFDPSLLSTHLDESYKVQTIVDYWGSKVALDLLQLVYGHQRFDANDPPLFIAHGTEDPTVLFSSAEELKAIYDANAVPMAYYPLDGWGHSAWDATVNGKSLEALAFDFIVEQQELKVE